MAITENSYEEVRRQRLLDNKQRLEDLGLLKLSRDLSGLKKSEKKSQQRIAKPKPISTYAIEPRRSSRARNPVPSYRDDVGVELPSLRIRSRHSSSITSYLARPIEEVKVATYDERAQAYKSAEKLQDKLQSGKPSFVKSMVRSHVYSCFWLGLPTKFCEDHLPKSTTDMVLENEEGTEYDAVFISKRSGLSGGWRAFALDHKLDDGDALVFELTEPNRFKVYIVRASHCQGLTDDDDPSQEGAGDDEETHKEMPKRGKKSKPAKEAGSDAEESLKAPKRMKKSSRVQEVQNEAEETCKKVSEGKKSAKDELKNSTKSKEEKSPQGSALRRSLRNK